MIPQTAFLQKDSTPLITTLKKTTAMALLSVTVLTAPALETNASSVTEEEAPESQGPATKLLTEWDGKITVAREAFKPVIQALKLLADQDFRQNVQNEQGSNFATYEKEKVTLAWNQQKIVVNFLKDLYSAHTKLIPDYYQAFNLLSQSQNNLEKEQKVSADLRETLKTSQEKIEQLQQEAINAPSIHNTDVPEERDLEAGQPSPHARTPLIEGAPSSNPWKTRTVIVLAAGCTTIGMGLGALITWFIISK